MQVRTAVLFMINLHMLINSHDLQDAGEYFEMKSRLKSQHALQQASSGNDRKRFDFVNDLLSKTSERHSQLQEYLSPVAAPTIGTMYIELPKTSKTAK